jgi:hypothetical protein
MGDHAPSPPKRRPGRPPVAPEDKRRVSASTYLSRAEFDRLYRDAQRHDQPLSTYLRACLLRAFER